MIEQRIVDGVPINVMVASGLFPNLTLNGKFQALDLTAANISFLEISKVPTITVLNGLPAPIGSVEATRYSELRALDCARTMVAESFYVNNKQLKTLKGAPRLIGNVFSAENCGLPMLFAVGRCRTVELDDDPQNTVEFGSVFRTKFKLVTRGYKGAARFTKELP